MPVFAYPLALIGLLAVPLLIAIYWLRSRARERQVSSLLLWFDERERWEGGRRIQKLQTPLLFFLELLAILALIAAAAVPMIRAGGGARPLVIVLDDSFSMLAGNEDSPRVRASRAIESELRADRYSPVRFVLAGASPQILGEATSDPSDAIKLLAGWKCGSATAKMDEAVSFAFELAGARGRVLAVSDRAPDQDLTDSRLQWKSFGASRPNIAFVNATRTAVDEEERILLEVANLSSSSGSTKLEIEGLSDSSPANSQSLDLSAGETRRITMTLKRGAPALRASLSDDALNVDNRVVLLPEANKVVRVDLQFESGSARKLFEDALTSAKNVLSTSDKPQLVITDSNRSTGENSDAWTLRMISDNDAASYLGPFVIDRSHPLTQGISLGGVVWGSGKSSQSAGAPVITAGNIHLLTDQERGGRHDLILRLRPELSTLHETPNWPILIWNLIAWRAEDVPGMRKANVRLGSEAELKVHRGIDSVTIFDPDNNARQAPALEGEVLLRAEKIGVYQIESGGDRYSFASNALEREESDLSGAASGNWGNWAAATQLQREYSNIAWAFLLAALALLATHAWLLARSSCPGIPEH